MKRDLFFVPRWNLPVFLRSAVVPLMSTTVGSDSHSRPSHMRHFWDSLDEVHTKCNARGTSR